MSGRAPCPTDEPGETVTPLRIVSITLDSETSIVTLTDRETKLLHVYGDFALASAIEMARARIRRGEGEQYVLLRLVPPGEHG